MASVTMETPAGTTGKNPEGGVVDAFRHARRLVQDALEPHSDAREALAAAAKSAKRATAALQRSVVAAGDVPEQVRSCVRRTPLTAVAVSVAAGVVAGSLMALLARGRRPGV